MKKLLWIPSALILGIVVSCAPNSQQLKKTLEEDPSIVLNVIEKHPEQFMDALNKAARGSQEKQQRAEMEREEKGRDEEFANPLKPDVPADRLIFGKPTAAVTIVEYSDFECPYCSRGYQTMKQVLAEYPNDVKIVFKHLPLDFHPKALPAAKMFEAIALQDPKKAEKFHDTIFQNQEKLKEKGPAYMNQVAKSLGLDMKKLEKDAESPAILAKIQADVDEAKKFGISGTPGFIINGVSLRGAYPFPEFKKIIDRHLAKK